MLYEIVKFKEENPDYEGVDFELISELLSVPQGAYEVIFEYDVHDTWRRRFETIEIAEACYNSIKASIEIEDSYYNSITNLELRKVETLKKDLTYVPAH